MTGQPPRARQDGWPGPRTEFEKRLDSLHRQHAEQGRAQFLLSIDRQIEALFARLFAPTSQKERTDGD